MLFDGVDCDRLTPNPAARFTLPDGRVLCPGDEVLSFVNRNLEPYRGYHIFMRALPEVLAARPEAQVVIVGGDGISYGSPPTNGGDLEGCDPGRGAGSAGPVPRPFRRQAAL